MGLSVNDQPFINRANATVLPVTPRACARVSPGRPAHFAAPGKSEAACLDHHECDGDN